MKKILTNRSNNETSRLASYWKKKGVSDGVDMIKFFDGFNFRFLEYGNWINQPERIESLRRVLLSCDTVLYPLFKSKNLGLDKNISVAIGGRGYGGRVAGHFEPSTLFINLAKNTVDVPKPMVSLYAFGHEYFHGLDYFLGRYVEPVKFCNYLSQSWDNPQAWKYPIRNAMSELLLAYYETSQSNPMYMKGVHNRGYWESPQECFARISEQCLCRYAENLAIKKRVSNYITRSSSYYSQRSNVYVPDSLLPDIYAKWLEVVKLIGTSMKDKTKKTR